ncbi:C-X-C motif chemokine 10-like [Protopterus annectens]|uniref:C-X-C motif chemokine 10-like n=1 Tax=Protopterus annectens TaxID=7888 RepID=UPI001CF9EDE5|nr:C-X-C motif chemokine 10-like [Protopterus annectens]
MASKTALLILFAICISATQGITMDGARCSCVRLYDKLRSAKDVKTLEIIPPSSSCENVEIIIHLQNQNQYCLNPKSSMMKELIKILSRKKFHSMETAQ